MKCILLLTFVALCYSYPYGYETAYGSSGRNINIGEDGTIVITGANGKRISITKNIGSSGQKNIDISVSGPNIPTKRIQINEQNKLSISGQGEYSDESEEYPRDKRSSKDSKKQRSQGDTLTKILSSYQGDIDQTSYQQLLSEVSAAVQAGQLSPSVYEVLLSLNQGQLGQTGYWGKQQGIIGQKQANVLDLLREQAIQQRLQQLQQEQQYQQLLQQQQYQQGIRSPIYVTQGLYGQRSQAVLDVPVGTNQQGEQIVERVYLWGPQTTSVQRGLDIAGQQGITGIRYVPGTRVGRTLWEPIVRDLLTPYGQQGQSGQIGSIGQSISAKLSEVIDEEREILDQQRQIQQQQLLQEREQQQLLVQQLTQQEQRRQQQLMQQQQQPEQQRQQQLWQQMQQQQLQQQLQQQQQQLQQQLQQPQQLQEELLQKQYQQQQQTKLRDYLLNGGRTVIQTRGQQGLLQQQPGVYSQGLYGGYGQDIPRIQRYNTPLIL